MRPLPQGQARRLGILVGGGAYESPDTGVSTFELCLRDLDAFDADLRKIALSFLAHGLTVDPRERTRLAVFEKHGPGGAIVDIGSETVIQTIPIGETRHFYGHGAYSRYGDALYVVESDLAHDKAGFISVRETKTYTSIGDFPSYGRAPHDCTLIDDGATLVVTNGGGPETAGNVAFVDVASQRLIERVEITDDRINAGHLDVTAQGDLAVVSAPRDGLDPARHPGRVSFRPAGGVLRTADEPASITSKMLGESLSVAIHPPTRVAAVTNPVGNLLTFWRLDTGELAMHMNVPSPRGVALSRDGREFVVNYGQPPRASRIDVATLTALPGDENRVGVPTRATGSHIFLLDL